MPATVQAPAVMMSQNRHAARDRLDARHDHEIDRRAGIEVMALRDWLGRQQERIVLLARLPHGRRPGA